MVPAKQNDVKLYIFKCDTKISEQKKFSKPLQKQACVLTVMYTTLVKIYLEFRRNPAGYPARTWPDLSGIPGGFRVDSG